MRTPPVQAVAGRTQSLYQMPANKTIGAKQEYVHSPITCTTLTSLQFCSSRRLVLTLERATPKISAIDAPTCPHLAPVQDELLCYRF